METDNHIVKYKGQIRKSAINILVWLENNPNPNEEKANELAPLQGKLKDAIFNFRENIKDWDKHTFVSQPLDDTRIEEHKEFLAEHQGVEGGGN